VHKAQIVRLARPYDRSSALEGDRSISVSVLKTGCFETETAELNRVEALRSDPAEKPVREEES